MATSQEVNPSPPILVVRATYRIGDRWEGRWQDAALGVQGVGTGSVVSRELVATAASTYDAFRVSLDYRIRGAVTGQAAGHAVGRPRHRHARPGRDRPRPSRPAVPRTTSSRRLLRSHPLDRYVDIV